MQHFTRQGQYEKAIKDAGYQVTALEGKDGHPRFFAFDGNNLMGHFTHGMGGTLAESNWESRCMESEICHPRAMD